MSAQTPVPKDDPLMIAWEEYNKTDNFANNLKWAKTSMVVIQQPNLEGSLWGVFEAGFKAGVKAEAHRTGARVMLQVGVEGHLFCPHTETDYCKEQGCIPFDQEIHIPSTMGTYTVKQQ